MYSTDLPKIRRAANLVAFLLCCAPLNAAQAASFDGNWSVEIKCSLGHDGAKPFTWRFPAKVQGGSLTGQFGQAGSPNSGTLTGTIDESGTGAFTMSGLTGATATTLGHPNPGSPFSYTVSAHFDAKHGAGKRNEQRDCSVDFRK